MTIATAIAAKANVTASAAAKQKKSSAIAAASANAQKRHNQPHKEKGNIRVHWARMFLFCIWQVGCDLLYTVGQIKNEFVIIGVIDDYSRI